jgi:hypothetical protein
MGHYSQKKSCPFEQGVKKDRILPIQNGRWGVFLFNPNFVM